jgi:ribosome-associated translation inhibitor RaiA
MDIQKSYDKVVLSNVEVQEALREYVRQKSGRGVRGHVVVNHTKVTTAREERTFCPQVDGSAYCYLESVAEVTL